jgi:hypothetical protein
MARFPRLIDAAVLCAAAQDRETHAMRVELRGAPSNNPYRLAGKGVQRYLLEYSPEARAHILDFPVSCWMEDREMLARDILGGPHSNNLVVLSVPWLGRNPKGKIELVENLPEEDESADFDELTAEQKAEQILEGMEPADAETEPEEQADQTDP